MSLSPRFRGVAVAVAALFASPSPLYAHLLPRGLGPLCNSVPVEATVAVLVGASFLSHLADAVVRAFTRTSA